MINKKILVMSTLLMAIVLLGIGTYSYFRRGMVGNIKSQTGDLVLIVNEANASLNETFEVFLRRSEEEPFIIPDDGGVFDLNIDLTGSIFDIDISLNITRTNLPDNLKFYLDEEHTNEIVNPVWIVEKSNNMRLTIPVYWFWDGSIDDENDSLFINKQIEANINISAKTHLPFETIVSTRMGDAVVDYDVDFTKEASNTNGEGLMVMNGTQNDKYPIVYYRGDVSNNNVIFADFCWLIVRTTETGGIKLVFNGPVVENADGTESCTNYSGVGGVIANTNYTDVYAGNTTTAFNTSDDSPVYVGYMYNDANKFYSSSTLDGAGYIAHLSDNTIDSTTGRHTQNLKDSTIKGVVDDWYEVNILGKPEESLLEDAVWCNERSAEIYDIERYANGTESSFSFAVLSRLLETPIAAPSLVCSRDVDKFTVDSANGNGDLDYPIGLLTADEIKLVGHPIYNEKTTYLSLTSGAQQWSLSPSSFTEGLSGMLFMENGFLSNDILGKTRGARPSISLNNRATISGGNGSFSEPYIINA